jgi:hypothetical protein
MVSMGVGRTQEAPAPEPVHASTSPQQAARPEAPAPTPAAPEVSAATPASPTSTPVPPASAGEPIPSYGRLERRNTPEGPATDSLRRELALLESIRNARLDAPRALGLVRRYRKAHPQGALASEVDALEVEALCVAEDLEAARAAAERFAARWPESSLRTSSVDPCKSTSR